ncbi:Endoribonuclease L-PSP/chorismate mutase-like protein [Xylariaceae sp. FL1272]|nr:Endoribonuclease L-PSP/chorismate mutase-like protein [Xylariaceae sp. FL1272]
MSDNAHPKLLGSSSTKTKEYYGANSPWEMNVGHYRAVRAGGFIFVSGTTSADPSSPPDAPRVFFPGDPVQQTRVTLETCFKAIQALGGRGAESIVRARIYVQRQEDTVPVAAAFKEFMGRDNGADYGTAATMLVVNGFCDPEMLVEIDIDAIADKQ